MAGVTFSPESLVVPSAVDRTAAERAQSLVQHMIDDLHRGTDQLFAVLMPLQWLGAIIAAYWIPSQGYEASVLGLSRLWLVLLMGGALTAMTLGLTLLKSGTVLTRHAVGVMQMLMSALLIQVGNGRVEFHFHIFGSLAFLAFYRDWKVLVSASLVVALHHYLLGHFAPQCIYGVLSTQSWRWLEHSGWVVFEDIFLILSIAQSQKEMRKISTHQANLETVNERIELQVQERTVELVAAREAALSASRTKSEFLSTMSHEIRTPMNAILGMAELLEETKLDADQRRFLAIINNNGGALLGLINDILDMAKVEAGRLSLERINFDLESVTDRVIETLALRAHCKGIELAARIHPDVTTFLVGDPLRLRQILVNLIGNAIKFTERGQVVLNVERYGSIDPGYLHFSVADSGIGIAKDKLDQIFSAFTQADSSTTRKYGGSGLGLAIVKRLVSLMEGEIWVESEPGKGTTIHFTAKFRTARAPGLSEKPSNLTAMMNGTRVLVVDDEPVNRLILQEMLVTRGAIVDQAADAPRALELLKAATHSGKPYRLVMLDCRMPGMDGFELAERIKSIGYRGLSVMMLTSDDLKADIARSRKYGLDAHLVKPVRRADLYEAIAIAMSHTTEPPRDAATPSPVATEGATLTQQPALRILMADDSPDNRLLVRAYLKNPRFALTEAENGALAVDQVKNNSFDVILMDIQMPVMDGLTAIRLIREWEKASGRAPLPIIALTASALDEDVRRTLEAGADRHVSKPVKKATLIAAIDNLTEGKPAASGTALRSGPLERRA